VLFGFAHPTLFRAAPSVVFVFRPLEFGPASRFSTGKPAVLFRAAAQRSPAHAHVQEQEVTRQPFR
jgi:hypothetical protein